MDKSNSNSEQSNFFVISSESSRSERKKKEDYHKFVAKIRDLVELQGGDLDELYQRVENIVRKYFNQHRVVDFKEMYDSLLGIRNNSKKMRELVAVLEKRLGRGKGVEREERSVKSQYFQTTIASQKETKNSLQQSKEDDHNNFFDGEAVNTSVKHNHVFKPIMKDRESHHQELTPKAQRSNQSEHTPSPLRQSPSKLNLSGEEYLNRNKEYEIKVREMIKELQKIKMKIKQGSRGKQDLRLELRENGEREKSLRKEEKVEEMNSKIMEASQHSNHSSQQSQKSQQIISTQQHQTHASPAPVQQPQIPATTPVNPLPRTTSLLDIMKNTQSITKQIQELKEVASRLEIASNPSKTEFLQSQTSIYPADKINQLIKKASENKKNQPLLEEIENTTSQMELSDGMIPSFKNLVDTNSKKYEILPGAVQVSSQEQLNSQQNESIPAQAALSSSQVVTSFYPNQQKVQSAATVKYIYNPYPHNNYQNQSLFAKPSSYRPVPVFQPTTSVSIQRIYVDQNPKPVQPPQLKVAPTAMMTRPSPVLALSPTASNNSSTSIMHPHLFNKSASFSNFHQPKQQFYPNPSFISPSVSSLQNRSSLSLKGSQFSSISRKGLNLTVPLQKKP